MWFNLFVFIFLVTPCFVVAVHPCMKWIPIKKKCNVHLFTIDLWPYLSVLKLFTFNWYVDDDLVVWFSGNLEGWNLSLKLPGVFSLRQSFTNMIFWSMMKSFSFSIFHASVFQLEHLRGGNLLSLLLYLFFFNWDSLHARLNSYYKAWSYKKKKHKRIKAHRKSV